VRPSDFAYAIERLFHVGSPGVGFYTIIQGADAYAAHKAAHISGIVADDKAMTVTFHLTHPDGAFLDIMAMPFAFAVPAGMPYKDISTDDQWRVATGPYMIKTYVPKQQIVLVRNPNFHQWSPNSPDGHLNEVHVQDTLLAEKTDPQIAFNHFDQDYPEGEDFIDTLLNGQHIVNVGNNDVSNTDDPALNHMIDQTKLMPLGNARNAMWAKIDNTFMQNDAGWAPFMHLDEPKFVSPHLHGLVFTGSYFELIPEMWLGK
jgi:ABC-type oligopeptide transport system substrate-binding subunit